MPIDTNREPDRALHAKVLAAPLILIVDDDKAVRASLACCLQASGYQAITAENGEEGLARFLSETPDAILIDIVMPERDGIETIRQIRQQRPDARVIAMSGGGQIEGCHYLKMATALGANMSLEKPIDVSRLLGGLRALIYEPAAVESRRASEPFRRWAEVRAHEALRTARLLFDAKTRH
jgi:DNA-binding response OmpR family regulator